MKKGQDFSPAFSVALDAYLKSATMDDVNQAISVLLEGSGVLRWDYGLCTQLEDIVINHRLRMLHLM